MVPGFAAAAAAIYATQAKDESKCASSVWETACQYSISSGCDASVESLSVRSTVLIRSSMNVPLYMVFSCLPNLGSSFLNSFRRPQFRASRPRVAINLFLTRRHWLLCQHPVLTLLHSLAEGIFHDAVFQRVKAD